MCLRYVLPVVSWLVIERLAFRVVLYLDTGHLSLWFYHLPLLLSNPNIVYGRCMSLLDHVTLSSRYFFPRRQLPPQPFWVDSNGVRLCCSYYAPHPEAPTLVYFHGNGEVVADYFPDFAREFSSLGLNCFFVEYRGYGGSTGEPALVSQLGDIPALIAALGVPPERLIAFGRSLGSLYAIELVHRFATIPKLIIESGISDLAERIFLRVKPEEVGGTKAQLLDEISAHFDQPKKLSLYPGKTLVLHTQHDSIVGASHAMRNAAASQHGRLHLFPMGDHNNIFTVNHEEYLRLMRSFIFSA
jgi:Serine aminopeptidase, S33